MKSGKTSVQVLQSSRERKLKIEIWIGERERDGVESSTVSKWNARSFRERDVCVGQRRRRIRGR